MSSSADCVSLIVDVKAFDLKNCLSIEPLLLSELGHEHERFVDGGPAATPFA
jgi:hypothetical protein